MWETEKQNLGNYKSMKKLYDAYEENDGQFGCKITTLKLEKKSSLGDDWGVNVKFKHKNSESRNQFLCKVNIDYKIKLDDK